MSLLSTLYNKRFEWVLIFLQRCPPVVYLRNFFSVWLFHLSRRGIVRRFFKPAVFDLSRIHLLRSKSREELLDQEWLERDLIPRLGLNYEMLCEYPPELYRYCGQGLFAWQYPNQFSQYLCHIARHGIRSYLEIGSRWGGTFIVTVEYLEKFHPLERAVAVDVVKTWSLTDYCATKRNARFLKMDTKSKKFKTWLQEEGPFDLVLIDGDHSEKGCRNDFEIVKGQGRVIVLHDITNAHALGPGKVWAEAKERYKDSFEFFEFVEQYDSVRNRTGKNFFGIGVMVRQGKS